jgi:hypothetical protein
MKGFDRYNQSKGFRKGFRRWTVQINEGPHMFIAAYTARKKAEQRVRNVRAEGIRAELFDKKNDPFLERALEVE